MVTVIYLFIIFLIVLVLWFTKLTKYNPTGQFEVSTRILPEDVVLKSEELIICLPLISVTVIFAIDKLSLLSMINDSEVGFGNFPANNTSE